MVLISVWFGVVVVYGGCCVWFDLAMFAIAVNVSWLCCVIFIVR